MSRTKRKKLKIPSLIDREKQDATGSLIKRRKSETTMIEAYLKMPFLPETHEGIREIIIDLLDVQKSLDSIFAETVALYEETLTSLQTKNKQLERENKGLLIELRRSMRINDKQENSNIEKEKPREEKNRRPGKRGAPQGHRGASRSVPSAFDAEEIIQPPGICDCGCSQILPLDLSDDKYIEDIAPVVKTVTKIRYLMGKCALCGKVVRSEKGVCFRTSCRNRTEYRGSTDYDEAVRYDLRQPQQIMYRHTGYSRFPFRSSRNCEQAYRSDENNI